MLRFMLEGPEIMAHWTSQQRHDLYRRLGIRVFALPGGGVEIEGIVELEPDRSTKETTYTPGTYRATRMRLRGLLGVEASGLELALAEYPLLP